MDKKKANKEVQNIENMEQLKNNSSNIKTEDKKNKKSLESSQSQVHSETVRETFVSIAGTTALTALAPSSLASRHRYS